MQTVSCVFIQTLFVLFSKQSRYVGREVWGREGFHRWTEGERKVKVNSKTQWKPCDQCECLKLQLVRFGGNARKNPETKMKIGFMQFKSDKM